MGISRISSSGGARRVSAVASLRLIDARARLPTKYPTGIVLIWPLHGGGAGSRITRAPSGSRHAGPEGRGLAGGATARHVGRPRILLMSDVDSFLAARDFLLARRERYAEAYDGFRWPT